MKLITETLIKNTKSIKIGNTNMLELWLDNISQFANEIVILDNMSNDGTYERIIEYFKEDNRLHISRSDLDFLKSEQYLHKELWDNVKKIAKKHDWVMMVSGDDIVDDRFIKNKDEILQINRQVLSFQLVHLWNTDIFRVDLEYGFNWTPRLFRYEDMPFSDLPLKGGIHNRAMPFYFKCYERGNNLSCSIYHYGYINNELRKNKCDKYVKYCNTKNDITATLTLLDNFIAVVPVKNISIAETKLNPHLLMSNNEFDVFVDLIKRGG